MTTLSAFVPAGFALLLLSVILGAAIVVRRSVRTRLRRRDLALVEPFRPLLVSLVVDDQPAPEAISRILAADRRAWRALEPHIIAMVRKLRGDGKDALVALLEERGSVDRLTRRLSRPGAVGRARAAELLGLLGEHAPRAALERMAVSDNDTEVRLVAVRALGEIGDPRSARPLVAAVVGPRAVPLRVVARSLARLGAGASPELVRALTSGATEARAVSAEILGLIGDTAAAGPLAVSAEQDPSMDVRIRSARSLGRIGVPSALPVLGRCTDPDQAPALRTVATRAIGDVGGPIALQMLAGLLDDATHRVASNAARALAGLGYAALPVLRRAAAGDGPGAPYAAEVLAESDLRTGRSVAALPVGVL